MSDPGRRVNIAVHADQVSQTIDGIGVNINARYWNDGKLIPTLDLLCTDLGATLFLVQRFTASTSGGSRTGPIPMAGLARRRWNRNAWRRSTAARYSAAVGRCCAT